MPSPEFDNNGRKDRVEHTLVSGRVVVIVVVTMEGAGVVTLAMLGGVPIAAATAAALIAADMYMVKKFNTKGRN